MEFSYEASRRKTFDGHKHYHESYEFYYLDAGHCGFLLDDKLYAVREGDLVIIPPQILHVATYSEWHSRLLITCDPDYLGGFSPQGGVYRNPAVADQIRALFKEAEAESAQRDTYSPMLLQGILCRLVALTERNPNRYSADQNVNGLIEAVLEELSRDFSGELTLNETARRHCVSPAHLSRSFKRETGMNFNHYLSTLRLKKAEQLLEQQPRRPIGEIAFACGFNDSNYFSEKFRSVYGCSPSAYRKR